MVDANISGAVFILSFLCVIFSETAADQTWFSDIVHIYNCHSSYQFHVRKIRNNARVIYDITSSLPEWIQFSNPSNSSLQMSAIHKNNDWYFMEQINGNLRIIKNRLPTGTQHNDNRLFEYKLQPLDRKTVLTHVITKTKVILTKSCKIIIGEDPSLAANLYMKIICRKTPRVGYVFILPLMCINHYTGVCTF